MHVRSGVRPEGPPFIDPCGIAGHVIGRTRGVRLWERRINGSASPRVICAEEPAQAMDPRSYNGAEARKERVCALSGKPSAGVSVLAHNRRAARVEVCRCAAW